MVWHYCCLRYGQETVGLDSEKSNFRDKTLKERKNRGKEEKRWGKEAQLMS